MIIVLSKVVVYVELCTIQRVQLSFAIQFCRPMATCLPQLTIEDTQLCVATNDCDWLRSRFVSVVKNSCNPADHIVSIITDIVVVEMFATCDL